MDAFTRKYKIKKREQSEISKEYQCVEIYTKDKIYKGINESGKWEFKDEKNAIGKIPVIYYEQDAPEWQDVITLINRVEKHLSMFADTNDYFGHPAVEAKGDIENAPEKDEVGKFFRVKGDLNQKTGEIEYTGGIRYITWEHSPESIKLEYEVLNELIHTMTDTPDLGFSSTKTIPDLSGKALKILFMGPILKAEDKQEIYGEGLERRNNLLKALLGKTNVKESEGYGKNVFNKLDISTEFQINLPEDVLEKIDMLSKAVAGEPIMSEEEAVELNPLVRNAKKVLEQIKKRREEAKESFGESFKI
jgi:SPP1 family phage portal protein